MPIVRSRSAHGVQESKCSKRPSCVQIYPVTQFYNPIQQCLFHIFILDFSSSFVESSSFARTPSFVHFHQGSFLLAPLMDSLQVHLELSCSCLLGKSFCQLHSLKFCCNGIRQMLTRCHSMCAVTWSVCHALSSWPRRVLETQYLFMYSICSHLVCTCVLGVWRLLEAGV